MAVADLNGDGKPDLVVANSGSNSVSVLLGNGDGTFLPPGARPPRARGRSPSRWRTSTATASPTSSSPTAGSDTVSVLLGNGDGTFLPQATFATGMSPNSVAVGDFNGDGKPDLVVANSGGNSVSVLLGTANFTGQVYTILAAHHDGRSPRHPGPRPTGSRSPSPPRSRAGGYPATAGTVTFSEGDRVLAADVPVDGNGHASFSISTLSATGSPHLISASTTATTPIMRPARRPRARS